MDDRTRRLARRHWAALDAAMTRTLPDDQVDWCREGVRWGLADIASKYGRRLTDAAGNDAWLTEADTVSRELAAALNAAWTAQNRRP